MTTKNDPSVEITMALPDILEGPVELPSGDMVAVGDKVEHAELGIGEVIRIGTYYDHVGILLFCDFPGNPSQTIGIAFVRKYREEGDR
jgi:hypothetical protein